MCEKGKERLRRQGKKKIILEGRVRERLTLRKIKSQDEEITMRKRVWR